jgi:hypothetical protein
MGGNKGHREVRNARRTIGDSYPSTYRREFQQI